MEYNLDLPEENFIRVYDNAVSSEFCLGIIEFFEWSLKNNRTFGRVESNPLNKQDTSVLLNPINLWEISFKREHVGGYIEEFNRAFWDVCYPMYAKEFDTLNQSERHSIYTYKVQKTLPREGYHVWHHEADGRDRSGRLMAYVLYLNDVSEGGETEFLYQQQRVAPKQGSLVIFPGAYTHAHRGNPPLSGAKYILTGWVEY